MLKRSQQGGRGDSLSIVKQQKSPVLRWSLDFFVEGKSDSRWRAVLTICIQLCLVLCDWKKNNHQPAAGQVHASHFIGFGELPGSSAEGFPLWQFNRCHSFRHIKDGRGRRASWKAVTRDRRVSFEVQGCRLSHLFPTLSRTSGIQMCCFYWPWTFKLFCWPFTSKLWTTDPG